ncbi:hypothetical protein ENSA7_25870 [Enhygromyxa salina]|uniref:VWFA domain-containing protein n=2 Tax=Enhygromyxa salina TaxID=215803 RepID=A0A2S9YR76_9BACT|nr:hypothetical protein ENSA7_25870 [Enhygromyxa salina]
MGSLPGIAFADKKKLIDHGDGTWSIAVHANFPPEDLGALEVTSDDADNYCDFFREGSRILWQVTNGQHYFDSVTFGYGASESDVFLSHGQGKSHASPHAIRMNFHSPKPAGTETIGKTLAHEWGHYFYGLPDEYATSSDLGLCADSRYAASSETCTGFPSSSCSSGARCIRHRACVNEGADITQAGTYDGWIIGTGSPSQDVISNLGIVSADQCAAAGGDNMEHPVCILYDPTGVHSSPFGGPEFWPNWGANCLDHDQCETAFGRNDGRCSAVLNAIWERPVCVGESTCIMADGAKRRWCDANTHIHLDPKTGASLSQHWGVLGTVLNHYPTPWSSAEDFNCWDQAKLEWSSLQFNGQYDDDIGLPPNEGDPDFCTWNVPDYTDTENLADWSMVMIDASGSMGQDANGNPGWTYAVDGGEYFNQVAVNKQTSAGLYAWGDDLWAVKSATEINGAWVPNQDLALGTPVDLAPDNVAVYRPEIDTYVNAKHHTNLCAVLEGAKAAFTHAKAPAGDREVVLLTDAKFTRVDPKHDPNGPAGCRGVETWIVNKPEIAAQICAEAGMRVNVITTGASPRIGLASWLAESCSGWHYYAGDEQAAGGSLPHAAKVYEAVAKAVVAGDVIALHERAPLVATMTTEARTFVVPAGARALDVAWLGSPLVVTGEGTDHAFNSLGFELESPTSILYSHPIGDSSEHEALYRRMEVDSPEPGLWTMRLDTSQLSSTTRAKLDVGWVASVVESGYSPFTWVDRPVWELGDDVTISTNVIKAGAAVGGMQVASRLSAAGHSWWIPMFDDGDHGDGLAGDGVYAAVYTPMIEGPHAVKVDYEIVAGVSHTIPGDAIFGAGPGPQILSDAATLVAHASFAVQDGPTGLVRADLPALGTGDTHQDLSATIEGIFLPSSGTIVSLGEGVAVHDLEVTCLSCDDDAEELDPAALVYRLRFDADVATDAPLTKRDLLVEIGTADYRDEGATMVVPGDRPASGNSGSVALGYGRERSSFTARVAAVGPRALRFIIRVAQGIVADR